MTEEKNAGKGQVRVFVYGSLKKGHCNHILLHEAEAEFLGYDSISGIFDLIDFGMYPAVMDGDSDFEPGTIKGEVWAGDEDMLKGLDWLEGHPNFYQRRKLWTDINKLRVWVYFLDDRWLEEGDDIINEGIWNPREAERDFWKVNG
jgi:gamma-glutamylaminecyclotransferase